MSDKEKIEKVEKPVQKEETYQIAWEDSLGVQRSGAFVVRALEGPERLSVERWKANIAGVPWDSLSPDGVLLCTMMATILTGVVKSPDWFDLTIAGLSQHDTEFLAGITSLVLDHTQKFRARHTITREGSAERPRFSCSRLA